jgi:opacity protein-like surface antigen
MLAASGTRRYDPLMRSHPTRPERANRRRAHAPLPCAARSALAAAAVLWLLAPSPASAQAPPSATARWTFELEGGPVWQSYNDVEIPNDGTATRFSLYDLAGSGPTFGGRLYATWSFAERHGLRLLLAPLTLQGEGVPDGPIDFAGASYGAGAPVEATYTFNSYRLSYRYRLHAGDRTAAWVGFTAKVRDAVIELEQGATTSRKTDLGFVPLLHLAGDWRFAPRWTASVDIDALAGGPGRAEDAALEIGYHVSDGWTVQLGYRTVEGGADVEEVYTFAWLHYAVASVVWRP